MTRENKFSLRNVATTVGLSIALASGGLVLTGCAEFEAEVESAQSDISGILNDAREQINTIADQGSTLIAEAKAFSDAAQFSVEDATTSAQNAATEARDALTSLEDKKADAEQLAANAQADLEEAKKKFDDLSHTLTGEELAKIEAERDRVVQTLDELITDLEQAQK
ncbi:hypothetical protein [Timonella sp. A28]|uniref:hypothetical protein n=1 Tax=Timonella sp. A28 TaxID=3442640 RepID=UPI003EB910BC